MFFGIEAVYYHVVSEAVYQTERWRMLAILLQNHDIKFKSFKIGTCHLKEVNINFGIYMNLTNKQMNGYISDYSCKDVDFNGCRDIQDLFIHRSDVEEIELRLEPYEGFDADYYFYNEFATQKFIDTYEDGTLITLPITNDNAELPFVWICEEIFKSLPPVDFEGNDPTGLPILTIGVDGHNVSHIYPLIYGVDVLPEQTEPGVWYIIAKSSLEGFNPSNLNNYNAKVDSIFYMFKPDDESISPVEYEISYEDEYIKISLSDRVNWEIIRETLNSPYYARIRMDVFNDNGSEDSRTILTEAFDISFSDDYIFNPYEGLCEGSASGIHVDVTSEYSENSVPTTNGIIHKLCEFDGLPSYFKTMHDYKTHRSHVELYTIRDRFNRFTQNTMDKQTSALILDSSMPQDDVDNIITDQDPAIIYEYVPGEFVYTTDMDKVVSLKNILI